MNTALTNKELTAGDFACRILQKGARGEVMGVFSQGIYCRVGENILLFHDAKWGYVPFGIAVRDIRAFSEAVKPIVGDEVVATDTHITVGTSTFAYAYCPPPSTPATCPCPPTKEKLRAVYEYLLAHGSHGGMLELLATNRGDARDAVDRLLFGDASAARKLIGLGRGLTPSGDDFLCGFLYMLPDEHPLATEVRAVIAENLDRTTDISAAYLGSVMHGSYFTIYACAQAVLFGEPFAENCDFVLSMGASSGTDTLLGALAAAKIML